MTCGTLIDGRCGDLGAIPSGGSGLQAQTVQALPVAADGSIGLVSATGRLYVRTGGRWVPGDGGYHVDDFGAVGDGVADDTVAIQAAIDYPLGSARIEMGAKTYLISASLVLRSGTDLAGINRRDTIVRAVSLDAPMIRGQFSAFDVSSANRNFNLKVRDLTLDNDAVVAGSVGVDLTQVSTSNVEHVLVLNCEVGFRIANVAFYNEIDNGTARGCDTGYHLLNGANENSLMFCRSQLVTDGVVIEDGADAGVTSTIIFQQEVASFSGTALRTISALSANVDDVRWIGGRVENPASAGVGFDIPANVRSVFVLSPKFANVATEYNVASTTVTVIDGPGYGPYLRLRDGFSVNTMQLKFIDGVGMLARNGVDTNYLNMLALNFVANGTTSLFQGARFRMNRGTVLQDGDFALSAGWGTTASISAIRTGSRDTRFQFTVSSSGSGQGADPTVTLTFADGAFPSQPFAVLVRNGGDQPAVLPVWAIFSTQIVITFPGTPVAGETYAFEGFVLA